MRLQLTYFNMLLGIESDIDSALSLDLVPADCPIVRLNNGKLVPAAFCDLTESGNKLERVMALLTVVIDKLLEKDDIDFTTTPIFWLLPELTVQGDASLIEWATSLKMHFPALFMHSKSQFFPFGRSAFMMSLRSMSTLFEPPSVTQVCVIALDSLYHDIEMLASEEGCLLQGSGDGLIPSEGVIVAYLTPSEVGINVLLNEYESALPKQNTQAVESLFMKVSNLLKEGGRDSHIDTFYAPGNGLAKITLPWLNAYARLALHVDNTTILKQLILQTGELGCVGGLYNFLHIYHAYENQSIAGITLQLEISDTLYQAVNVYSWSGKD